MKENNKIYLKLKSLSWGKIILIFLTVVSFLLGLFVYYPSNSISPGQTLDPYNPFKTPFILKNNGYLFIKNYRRLLKKQKFVLLQYVMYSNILPA